MLFPTLVFPDELWFWGEVWWQTLVCTCSRRTISLSTCDSANSKSCVKQVVSCLLSNICEVLQVNNKIRWINKSIWQNHSKWKFQTFFEFKTPSHSGLQLGITTPVAGLHITTNVLATHQHTSWWHTIRYWRPPWLAKQRQALPGKSVRVGMGYFLLWCPNGVFSSEKNAWHGAARTCFRWVASLATLWSLHCLVRLLRLVLWVILQRPHKSSNSQLRPVLTNAGLKGWRCSRCSSFTCCFGLFSIQPSTWRNKPSGANSSSFYLPKGETKSRALLWLMYEM